jgi:hypothetical protein
MLIVLKELLHFKGKWELQTMMPKVPEGEPGGKH